jgi:hypothetical protein
VISGAAYMWIPRKQEESFGDGLDNAVGGLQIPAVGGDIQPDLIKLPRPPAERGREPSARNQARPAACLDFGGEFTEWILR